MAPRKYEQSARREAVLARRQRVIDTLLATGRRVAYDEITLELLAEGAGVSVRTITRLFGSKEGIFRALMESGAAREISRRVAVPGDIPSIVAVLSERYEATSDVEMRNISLQDSTPLFAEWIQEARAAHLEWLATMFAPWLPEKGPLRTERLMALFGATEIYVWFSVRRRLRHGRKIADSVMTETLTALVERWERHDRASRR